MPKQVIAHRAAMRAVLVGCLLLASGWSTGCTSRADDCRSFPDVPRVIFRYAERVEPSEVEEALRARGWTVASEPQPRDDRVYAGMADLVLAYYDGRPHGTPGSSVEVFQLGASSPSEAETRARLAPAEDTLDDLQAMLGSPTETRVESMTTQCASAWMPEGCEPGPRMQSVAPWNATSPTSAPPQGGCQPVMAD